MKNQLVDLIVQRLHDMTEPLKREFFHEHPIKVARHFALDNLLPDELAERIYADFPKPNQMRLLTGYNKCKLKQSSFKDTSSLLKDLTSAIQDPRVIAAIEEITEIKGQIADPTPLAGGVSALFKGHFINPHLDNSHDMGKKNYRTVNLLYYVSPNWERANGGHYEIWDESVQQSVVVPCCFNRLVVMETNHTSWHSVSPVLVDAPRCCVFNYYFSEQSPEGKPYYNVTAFSPRPEQKVHRTVASIKNRMRESAQKLFRLPNSH